MEFKQQKDKLNLFNDLRSYSRHWVKEFIEAYKNEICLWQTKHPDYNNHILRNQAYDKLVEKLKEVESNPDRQMVVRKINSLRSAFRREFRKKCVKPDYEPRLWYYNALAFIADQQFVTVKRDPLSHSSNKNQQQNHHGNSNNTSNHNNSSSSRSSHEKAKKRLFSESFDEDETEQQDNDEMSMTPYEDAVTSDDINVKEENVTARMIEVSSNGDQQMITIEHHPHHHHHHQEHEEKMIEIHTTNREKDPPQLVTFQNTQREQETQQAVNSITSQQQPVPVHTIQIQTTRDAYDSGHHDKDHQLKVMNLYKPDCIPVLNTSMVKHDDEYDAIGINVASKLRSMNHHQRIIAEKLISDVLFSGQLDSLTVQSKLVV